jgi:hypothetical protein
MTPSVRPSLVRSPMASCQAYEYRYFGRPGYLSVYWWSGRNLTGLTHGAAET